MPDENRFQKPLQQRDTRTDSLEARPLKIPWWEILFLRHSLALAEWRIARHLEGETIAVFDSSGKCILLKRVAGREYTYSTQEAALLRGCIITHNHPGGNSFSTEDVRTACIAQVAQMRAVTRQYIYTLEPPETGWDDTFWAYLETIIPETDISLHRERLGLPFEQYEQEYLHRLWQEVAERVGMRYNRRQRKK